MKNESKEVAELQAIYLEFLSGQYKNCLNQLQKLTKNHPDKSYLYQHNYNICQYTLNRSALQAYTTLNKMHDLLTESAQKKNSKKGKEDIYDGTILKYNISVLMGVIGRRDNMEMILKDLYYSGPNVSSWKYAFLLLESQLLLDQKFDCIPILKGLQATRGLPKSVNDKDEKNSKIKFSGISLPDNSIADQGTYSRQQYNHILNVFKSILYTKLGLVKSAASVLPQRQNNRLIQGIKDGAFNYKNSNLFQLNLLTMMKFASAQLEYQSGNYHKSLKLLNPGNLMQPDINSNKYWTGSGHLALNNIGLINFRLQKYSLALFYISKSLQNLTKFTVANAEQRQQIICQHFQSRHEFVMYNQALLLLKVGKAKQAYEHFSSLQKSTKSYKFWYRFGESTLKFFHTLLKQNFQLHQTQFYSQVHDQHNPSYYYPNVPYVKQEDKKGRPTQPHKGPFYKRYVLHPVDHFIEEGSVQENKKITKTESSLLHLKAILDMAQNYFENALISIEQNNIQRQVSSLDSFENQSQVFTQIQQKNTKQNLMKEHKTFKQSILTVLAYISICKEQHAKTIKICRQILSLPDIQESFGYHASMYLMQAYLEIQQTNQAIQISQNEFLKPGLKHPTTLFQFRDTLAASQTKNESVSPDIAVKYNMAVLHIRSGNLVQANLIINNLLNEMGIVVNSFLAKIPSFMLNLLIYWNLRTDNPWGALQLIKHRRIISSPINNNNQSLLNVLK